MSLFGLTAQGFRAHRLLELKIKAEFSMPCSSDLLDSLQEMCNCEASDPRDLIYACFGTSSHTYGLHPDYASSLSVEDVLVRVAQNVITHRKSLGILRSAYVTNKNSLPSDIPSWVPDWRTYSRTPEGDRHGLLPQLTDFFAFHPDERGRPGRILQVRGLFIKIVGSGEKWPRGISSSHDNVPLVGDGDDGDEVYLLHGLGNLFVLRRCKEYFVVVGEVLGSDGILPGVDILLNDLDRMVEKNDPAVVVINIC